jgi:hypothetical protein
MKNWILITLFLFLISCSGKIRDSYFTSRKAGYYFSKVERICNRDNGELWGKNLSGPLMFIDRNTRKIVANQPDSEGILKLKDSVYTGIYPKEKIIYNSSVMLGGTLFGMAPLTDTEDEYRITTRAIHALFHRFQEVSGIPPSSYIIPSMDEKQARIWLKLEWEALGKAINSQGEERLRYLRDALIFRGANHESFPADVEDEKKFESYEGFATYTYLFLCTGSPEEFRQKLFEYLDRIYSFQSYSRSYGFVHGALYATLLHEKGFDFRTIKPGDTDPGELARSAYGIELPALCRDVAGSIALNYDIEAIRKEEEQRLREIKDRLNSASSIFTEKPVVYLELESPYFDFEPEDVHSLDSLGTLYNSIRVSDNWGKLTVDKGGCLVSNNFRYLRITARDFKKEKNHVFGEGWQLILKDNWEIAAVKQNYYIRQKVR